MQWSSVERSNVQLRWIRAFGCGVLLVTSFVATQAGAQVRGEITGPGASRLPVAVPDLKQGPGANSASAAAFVKALRADLDHSGLFRVINPMAYIHDAATSGVTSESIQFENWRTIGALGLAAGSIEGGATGLAVDARYFDVANRSMVGGRRFVGTAADGSRMGHRMADAIIEFVTGMPGPFESRIAFISDRGGRFREVYAYTFDGEVRQITNHRSITMSPSWHPSSRSLLFTSFKEHRPMLFSVDLGNAGGDSRIASKMGVNVGASYSPDARKILLAREEAGNTDLYELDPGSASTRRLTSHWGIDVGGSWSPDGRRIAFCSARSGTPQIYVMSASGEADARRLTFEGDYNCSPCWSPDGKNIAFAGRRQGAFHIFVVPVTGGSARQVTFAGSNEDPTWSPDSRYIAFTGRRGAQKKIYMTDILGRWERQLTDGPGSDSSPAWSRRLN